MTEKTRSVKVDKNKLLERLKENREKHCAEFGVIFDAYRNKVSNLMKEDAEELQIFAMKVLDLPRDQLVEATSYKFLSIPRPEDHSADYDRAIDRIEWEQEKFVIITEDDFNCYVRDEWQWRQRFRNTTRAVTG